MKQLVILALLSITTISNANCGTEMIIEDNKTKEIVKAKELIDGVYYIKRNNLYVKCKSNKVSVKTHRGNTFSPVKGLSCKIVTLKDNYF
jgi:hypothetical protein